MDISDIASTHLKDDIIGPTIIEEYRNQVTKTMKVDKYMKFLANDVIFLFQVFESFLRTEIHFVDEDIRLILDEYNSSFFTYELEPGIYTFKELSAALFNILQPEFSRSSNVIDFEFDDITGKIKLVVRDGIIAITFDEISFFISILGFNPHWDYKHYNEDIIQKL